MKNITRFLVITSAVLTITFSAYSQEIFRVASIGIGTTTPAQKLEIAGSANTMRINGLTSSGSYYQSATLTSSILYVNDLTGDIYALPNGTSGTVLSINSVGVPTWSQATSGTVTEVTGNSPIIVTNSTTTPVISLIGTAGAMLYGTGTASAFTLAGTAGQILESAGSGVPTWVTGSGQFIQNQSSAQQTANFWISGNASIGTAPVSGQQLTISSSGSSSIGIYSTNTAGSGTSIEGINSGGGTGVFGTVSGNTSSNNGGYGIEGAASSGGVGIYANSSGQTNAAAPLGGFGVFATSTYNSQAGVYAFLNGVSGSTPSPHGTTIPALGAVYAQTTSTSSTTTPNAWAIIANNSGSATPTNNGLLVFGTTSEIGTVTLGANSTSYFTTGGAKANGSLVFDNSTNTNTVTINTGVTTSSYNLNLPTVQASASGQVLTNDGAGNLSWANASSTLSNLTNGTGIATFTYNGSSTTTVGLANTTIAADSYGNANDFTTFTVNAQGQLTAAGTEPLPTTLPPSGTAGGDLGSAYPSPIVSGIEGISITGAPTGDGQVLEYNGTNWVPTTASTGSVISVTAMTPLSFTNSTTTPVISLPGATGTILYGTGTASAFTAAGTSGEVLESMGSGIPTWATGSGQFIQNQISAQSGANFDISGSGTIATNLTLSSMTSGSLLFAGSSGVVSQDNSNLYYNSSNHELGVGTSTPSHKLDVNGVTRSKSFVGKVRATSLSSSSPSTVTVTLDTTDYFVIFTNGGSAPSSPMINVVLPAPNASMAGQTIIIRNAASSSWTLEISSSSGSQIVPLTVSTANPVANITYSTSGSVYTEDGKLSSGSDQAGAEFISDGNYWYEIY